MSLGEKKEILGTHKVANSKISSNSLTSKKVYELFPELVQLLMANTGIRNQHETVILRDYSQVPNNIKGTMKAKTIELKLRALYKVEVCGTNNKTSIPQHHHLSKSKPMPPSGIT